MRKSKLHTVTRGCVQGQGPSRKDAKLDLERRIDWALQYNHPFVECRYGHVLYLVASANGWQSRVVRPDEIATHGKLVPASCMSGQGDRDREIATLRNHVAQCAWTHATDDISHVEASGLDAEGKRELARWCRFQRDYAEHIKTGETPARAHALACGYEHTTLQQQHGAAA
jgi:hypothetical protein